MTAPGLPAHPRALAGSTLLVTLPLAVLGAVVGLQTLTTLGVTPNTSLIGVLLAIAASRVPVRALSGCRSIHVQNLVQTAISSATFGAANSLLLPIGVPVLAGRPDLVPAALLGATCGMLVDVAMLYGLFDSRVFPAPAPWPHGIAAAEAILAGDRGGRRAAILGAGTAAGLLGSSSLLGTASALTPAGIPMSAFGVACIGSPWALGMFGAGLLAAAYAPSRLGVDLARALVPHGMMVGAGLAALGQALAIVLRASRHHPDDPAATGWTPTRSDRDVARTLATGGAVYLLAATMVSAAAGLWADMTPGGLVAWIVFAAAASIAAQFIVGLSAMHAGWFPAFATALTFLLIGLAAGAPPAAAALLVGFVASGGPAFADAGYDFKAGWLLRRDGGDARFERAGRREQLLAGLAGLAVGWVVVALVHDDYFALDRFPPIDRVYAATILAGVDRSALATLAGWAVPGALVQLLGGSSRQLGVLLATGLLVGNGAAGWAVLAGLAVRLAVTRAAPGQAAALGIFGAGAIAGDALWGFGSSVFRAMGLR
jgi:uncharacterized oligopeptide transporter (OPT) family protein